MKEEFIHINCSTIRVYIHYVMIYVKICIYLVVYGICETQRSTTIYFSPKKKKLPQLKRQQFFFSFSLLKIRFAFVSLKLEIQNCIRSSSPIPLPIRKRIIFTSISCFTSRRFSICSRSFCSFLHISS